jgi:ubiquitin-like protein Pup
MVMGERLQQTKERAERVQTETVRKTGSATVEHARKTVEETQAVETDIDNLLEETLDSDKLSELLDAIDEVLEPNAQEYVDSFRQKGGQ